MVSSSVDLIAGLARTRLENARRVVSTIQTGNIFRLSHDCSRFAGTFVQFHAVPLSGRFKGNATTDVDVARLSSRKKERKTNGFINYDLVSDS